MKASKIIEGAMLAAAAGTAAATGKFVNDVVCREKCMPPIRRRTFRVKQKMVNLSCKNKRSFTVKNEKISI